MKYLHFSIDAPSSGPICDFCSATPIWASYCCDNFVVNETQNWVSESIGGWAACKLCSELIEAEKWEDLLDRSCEQYHRLYGEVPGLRQHIKLTHDYFRRFRKRAC